MFRKDALLASLHFFMIVLFAGLGGFCFILARFEKVRYSLAQMIVLHPETWNLLGWVIFGTTALLFLGLWFYHRHRSLLYIIDRKHIEIHPNLIQKSLKQFFSENFDHELESIEVNVNAKRMLEIVLHDPQMKELSSSALDHWEILLSQHLKNMFDYDRKFYLQIKD